ncbi:hypothetical protein CUPS4244_07345 [Campylobacter upsaliensis]|uniref:hypothetical protein n=1 Tax=Campylobacter upsaliensis TaxID=28080 RepID=UPI002149BD9E|nr:hypothetical protein [Campylobacter upsaliensis]MCR2104889.1 hypothetical protein [Campylobacter upsaliensis]
MKKHEDKYYENINYKLCIAMLVFIIFLFCCGLYYLDEQPVAILLLCILPVSCYIYIELLFGRYRLKLKKQNKDTKYIDRFAIIGGVALAFCMYISIIIAAANFKN